LHKRGATERAAGACRFDRFHFSLTRFPLAHRRSLQRVWGAHAISKDPSMTKQIAIIGMGCSGTLVLRTLTERLKQNDSVEILLFEQSGEFGPGLPYGRRYGDDCFILNMQSSLLGANLKNEREFFDWLAENSVKPQDDAALYVRRSLMGDYLNDLLQMSLARLDELNIRYSLVSDEVLDIRKTASAHEIVSAERMYQVDHVVLALGHLKKLSPFPENERYIANPYHELDVIRNIPRDARIGILGTKLTAVDMALLLHKNGFEKLCMFSKSGTLPLVRGTRQTEYCAPEPARPETHTLSAFLRTLRRQLHVLGDSEYAGFVSDRNEYARLKKEIKQSAQIRKWHALLDRSKDFIDEFWLNLSTFKKHLFLRKYQGMWMSYRHPMPLANARKISQLLGDRLLSIHAGYASMKFSAERQAFDIEVDGGPITVDYVVDATGTPVKLRKIDSPLIRNLTNSDLVTQCEFGGVQINPRTYQLKDHRGIFIIGHLTRGTVFYVSAVERLLVHADVIASQLAASAQQAASGTQNQEKGLVRL
jgi:uncharacterized NAD(P)/FAD-binding protein YdhS